MNLIVNLKYSLNYNHCLFTKERAPVFQLPETGCCPATMTTSAHLHKVSTTRNLPFYTDNARTRTKPTTHHMHVRQANKRLPSPRASANFLAPPSSRGRKPRGARGALNKADVIDGAAATRRPRLFNLLSHRAVAPPLHLAWSERRRCLRRG